ncbi:MAG TPA: hypothetical protein VHB47_21140 [Thermoanaerobaculia bacterium]|jgi:hypothetical protein|nr:hypothetical protein [Thermoanaerobaculia bacterium]
MAGSTISLQISAAQAQYLERRGGRSHRGRGTFSRSVVLGRVLESHRLYQEFTDPRLTRGMPEELHTLVIRLLPEPWALRRLEIQKLEDVLELTPGFAAAVRGAGVDPAVLLAVVAAATPAEKLTLVDHAIQHQAPAAAAGSPDREARVPGEGGSRGS